MDYSRIHRAILASKIKEILTLLYMIDISIMTKSNLKTIYKVILKSLFVFKIVSVSNKNILKILVKSLYYIFSLLYKNLYLIDDPSSVTKKLDSVIFHLKLLVYSSIETDSGGNIEITENEIIINDRISHY
jgi:hypothetical protein